MSPLTFHVVSLDADEGKETPEWHGTYFLTIKDQMWPEAPEQREETVTNPYIGMAAFQLVDQVKEGAIWVNRYFIMKKSGGKLQIVAYIKGRERGWNGNQQANAGCVEMKEGMDYFQWQSCEGGKIRGCEGMSELNQAMVEGRIGLKTLLRNNEGKEELYCIIPATRETLPQNFPSDDPVYDYHIGIADAPTAMQEGLDPGPEEGEVQPAEKPYDEMARNTLRQMEKYKKDRIRCLSTMGCIEMF